MASASSKLVIKDGCYKEEASAWYKYTEASGALTRTKYTDACSTAANPAVTQAAPASCPGSANNSTNFTFARATASGDTLTSGTCAATTATRKVCFAVYSDSGCTTANKETVEYLYDYAASGTPQACVKYGTTPNYAKVTVNSSTADNGDIEHSLTASACTGSGTA